MTSPFRQVTEVNQEAPRTLLAEDNEFIGTFASADATPSVLNLKRWKAGNTGANDITYFDDGFEGKEISILGDGFSTVKHNAAKIKTNQAADKLLSTDKVYRFTLFSGVWVEDEDLTGGGGAGDPPSGTVVTETAFGQASAVGVANNYSRGDHTHGTMADPVPAHVALGDPHAQYQKESEKGAASGYASLDAGSLLPLAQLPPHHLTHERFGADIISVEGLSGLLADAQIPLLHHARHEDGGADEITVLGLSGLLADAQTPLAHKVSHQDGGADEILVTGLSGLLADPQTPLGHHVSHEDGGTDEVNLTGLSGQLGDLQSSRYDVGTITIAAGRYLLQYQRIVLSGAERLTISGVGNVVIADLGTTSPVIIGTPRIPQISFIVPDGYFADIIGTLILNKLVRATLQGLGQLIITDDFKSRSRIVLAGRG